MDIKQIATFLAFAKDGSYNRVSQKLNYSVSTLTSHISSLENEFHVELVGSRGRKSFLTPAGEAFLPYAKKIMEIYQEAYIAMTASEAVSGNLQVVVSEAVGLHRLATIYAAFARDYPQVKMTVRVGSTQNFTQKLLNRDADVAFFQDFLPPSSEQLAFVELYDEPVVLVAPPQHPLAKKSVIFPGDLKHQTLIFPRKEYAEQPVLRSLLQESLSAVNDNLFLDSGILLIQTIKSKRCLSFMPLSSVQDDLDQKTLICLPWGGEPIKMTIYAMYEPRSLVLPSIEALISFVRLHIKESSQIHSAIQYG